MKKISEIIDYRDSYTVNKVFETVKQKIMNASKLVEVEDLYRPFKERKQTKASLAIEQGLEPLAKIMMSFPINGNREEIAEAFNKGESSIVRFSDTVCNLFERVRH